MNRDIFYNKKEINDIIVKNWLKMLTNRGIFDINNFNNNYDLLKQFGDNIIPIILKSSELLIEKSNKSIEDKKNALENYITNYNDIQSKKR